MKRSTTYRTLQVVSVRRVPFVRERGATANVPEVAARALQAVIGDGQIREHAAVLYLDRRHGIRAAEIVSIGTGSASLIDPAEIFRGAILEGAPAIIFGHNHPSGDPTPSREDCEVTERLYRCGKLLGVMLIDSIVVADGGKYFSLRENSMGGLE